MKKNTQSIEYEYLFGWFNINPWCHCNLEQECPSYNIAVGPVNGPAFQWTLVKSSRWSVDQKVSSLEETYDFQVVSLTRLRTKFQKPRTLTTKSDIYSPKHVPL
ncbi:hypothetical protein CEXT_565651 [Caerostris extrusa]|uniref:Uncharacterized protein n=1 Tax=Caerostris extrusa TaxID=172846 RepID=A0AAV4VE65_CAEEX|nr:hypothetical protein CEXT_565651 [Caerostris extrusa]